MLALDCPSQPYDWGSTEAIPEFRRHEPPGGPMAEVWLGTHPLGTARFRDEHGVERGHDDDVAELLGRGDLRGHGHRIGIGLCSKHTFVRAIS